MDLSSINIAAVIQETVVQSKTLIANLIRSRFGIQTSLFQTNDLQQQAVEQIIQGIQVQIVAQDNGFKMDIDFTTKGPYFDLITKGQGSVVLGGAGGIVHLPNGGTTQSKVPTRLWGTTTNMYAREGINLEQQIQSMAQKIFADAVNDAMQNSQQKISEIIMPQVAKLIGQSGGS